MQHTLALATVICLGLVTGPVVAAEPFDVRADMAALSKIKHRSHRSACAEEAAPQHARCFARIVTDEVVDSEPSDMPAGYGPSDLQSAYNLPSTGGRGKVVAVIDAFDVPNAEADLAQYRSKFGLPPCTTANGCFRKVNQTGGADLPGFDKNWAGETTLDIEMVSATCPDCGILLVEASSDYVGDLWAALTTAIRLGASAATNSYGFAEVPEVTWVEPYFDFPGVLVTASSGDSGYAVQYPASSSHVLAVGGTTLKPSTSTRGWAESAWSSGGSGCSAFIPKPAWQKGTSCANRMEVDVAAVADPDTGVAVYCSDCGASHQGWQVMGGTSVAAPLVAGAFTVLGLEAVDPSFPSSHSADFFDVVQGTNGTCESASFCNAGRGYDGPTGWGTLNGTLLALTAAAGSAPIPTDGGASAVAEGGTGRDGAAAQVSDAGRDTGTDGGTVLGWNKKPDSGSGAPQDAGSNRDGAAKADGGEVETLAALDAGTDARVGGGVTPSVVSGLECSLSVRADGGRITQFGLACVAVLAAIRRRKR